MGTSPWGAPHVPACCEAEVPCLQPGRETSRAAPDWGVIAGKIWHPPQGLGEPKVEHGRMNSVPARRLRRAPGAEASHPCHSCSVASSLRTMPLE